MIGMKKFLSSELVHLTILLSLLRIDPNSYLLDNHGIDDVVQEIVSGSSSAAFMFRNMRNGLRSRVHPKNIENTMLLNQRDIFYELNSLGRYDRYSNPPQEITTYLLCGQEAMSVVPEDEAEVVDGGDVPETEGLGETEVRPSVNPEGDDNSSSSSSSGTSDITPSLEGDLSDMLTLILPQDEATGSATTAPYFTNLGDISKEDMDLIEILLRQDIDLGVTREVFDVQLRKELIGKDEEESLEALKIKTEDEKDAEKDPDVLDPWSGLNYTIDCETGEHVVLDEAGPSTDTSSVFTVPSLNTSELLSLPDELDSIPLEELSLVSLTDKDDQEKLEDKDSGGEELEDSSDLDLGLPPLLNRQDSFTEELKELEEMIQTAQLHHDGQGIQYLRSVSMEQRWQDLTTFLSFPPNSEAEMHHHLNNNNMGMEMLHGPEHVTQHNYTVPIYSSIDNRTSVLIQNATLPQAVADINSNMSYPGEVGGDYSNVGVAVVTSMSTLANNSDSMSDTASHGHYDMNSGTMMFPSNHTDVNQSTDGFLSSILNDEDLQLMDMAMNEGMYTMRMLENDDAMDTSSDSAVSSMGSSERVPSISDGQEWMETASESSRPDGQDHFYGNDHPKIRQFTYSYAPGMAPTQRPNIPSGGNVDGNATGVDRRSPPVAQKKYQLFGKRLGVEPPMGGSTYGALPRGSPSMPQPTTPIKYPDYMYHDDESGSSSYGSLEGATASNTSTEQIEPKYSCSVEFSRHNVVDSPASLGHIRHNHSYHLSSNGMSENQRPAVRDKQKKLTIDDHLPRDEKRARALKIPLTIDEIINLPMDEFNERLSKYDLTEQQLALIRDIRRRGKNKVAAQNCRKRKLDQIIMLAEEVQDIHREREQLLQQQRSYLNERQRMKDKFSQLYRHVFQSLRDPDGNPYSPNEYSLQQVADGNILLVPRNGTVNLDLDPSKGAKNKRKEESKK